jgi:hypothetical protein
MYAEITRVFVAENKVSELMCGNGAAPTRVPLETHDGGGEVAIEGGGTLTPQVGHKNELARSFA